MDKFSSAYYETVAQKLYTGVLADVMDQLGYRQQVMRSDIRPLYAEAKIVGRAATMLTVDAFQVPAEPYALELLLMDSLKPGEVVVSASVGVRESAVWGELLSTAAQARGARGALIDGFSRDRELIAEMAFPVFARGLTPADSRGRADVIAIREPVEAGGVLVNDGDLIFADHDGCVAVPQAIEAEVLEKALEKASGENTVRDLLRQGKSMRQVFADYGIL